MQFQFEYSRITIQILHSISSTVQKCFNHECQVPIAHSVFKQTVLNVSAHQLKQYTIEICCKMIHYCLINELVKRLIPSRLQNGLLARYDHASPMAWQL